MSKYIVFCADGTWDGADEKAYSNVLKLFKALTGDLTKGTPTSAEQEKQTSASRGIAQVSKYIHGVGDSQNRLHKWLGGSLGTGLVARLLRGYTFISRQYRPGDAIVLTGFSRGAYTARALGGFICTMGLLDWTRLGLNENASDDEAYGYAAAAWHAYQQQRHNTESHAKWLAMLQDFATQLDTTLQFRLFKPQYVENVAIKAIGVWDTVGALGIPELSPGHGSRLDLLRFVDRALSPRVEHGFHAIAADEERIDFSPTLWDPPDPARITQCFFPGAHADVGGGYLATDSQSLLSDGALAWMSDQLARCGVQFASPPAASAGCALGPSHMPWTSSTWQLRPTGPREFPKYRDSDAPVGISAEIRARLRQPVDSLTDTVPPIPHRWPYIPLALGNAGYLDLSSLAAKP